MPPPAAPTHRRQKLAVQPEAVSSASAVMRPETVVAAPEKVRILGSDDTNGPVGDQVLKRGASGGCFLFFFESMPFPAVGGAVLLAEVAWNLLKPSMAFNCAENGVSSAGKARFAASSVALVSGVATEPSFMDFSAPAPLTLSRIEDLDRAVLFVDAASCAVNTFVVVATNASAAAAAKNAKPAPKRRYVMIRLFFVFMEFGLEQGLG